jgi:hypothetical protein
VTVVQPRDVLGRFAALDETGPLLLTERPSPAELPPPRTGPAVWSPDPGHPFRTLVAQPRCPHGSFLRWARTNCRSCKPTTRTRRTR